MATLAETLIRGSRNLDQMRLDTKKIVYLVCKGYLDLGLGTSSPEYFTSQTEGHTFWDFHAHRHGKLDMRCISHHPSVCDMVPAIVFTTDPKWLQHRITRHLEGDYYEVVSGMKSVQLVYEALDDLLDEIFTRRPSFRSHLQPMITAGQMS